MSRSLANLVLLLQLIVFEHLGVSEVTAVSQCSAYGNPMNTLMTLYAECPELIFGLLKMVLFSS